MAEVKPETKLTHSALSLVRNGNNMDVIRIKFNPTTKEVGEVEIVATSPDRKTGEERFKILTVAEGIFA